MLESLVWAKFSACLRCYNRVTEAGEQWVRRKMMGDKAKAGRAKNVGSERV